MEKKLELRMYGLVPYNISPIQQGIQFGHAVVEYGQRVKGLNTLEEQYNNWAYNHKTFIILNGGTTNNNPNSLGSLNEHLNMLANNDIVVETFNEPDLGDQLTAIVFIVDERVFNKELYPDYQPLTFDNSDVKFDFSCLFGMDSNHHVNYMDWVESVGGEKNVFLRDFLKTFRLA